MLPAFATEVILTVERPLSGAAGCHPEAVLWCRAPAAAPSWLGVVAAVAREVEILAGVLPADELRLRPPRALPGLDPISPATVLRQLRAAGQRGLLPPSPPASGGARLTGIWLDGPGAVVCCWDGSEPSAQAVVVLHGRGDPGLLAPRPGGATIVRAWRVGRVWGVVCALVLGAAGALDLGREAARLATAADATGWQASVPRCADAVAVARAGDPRQPIPLCAARRAAHDELAALLASCLATGLAVGGAPTAGQVLGTAAPAGAGRRERLVGLLEDLDGTPGPQPSGPPTAAP